MQEDQTDLSQEFRRDYSPQSEDHDSGTETISRFIRSRLDAGHSPGNIAVDLERLQPGLGKALLAPIRDMAVGPFANTVAGGPRPSPYKALSAAPILYRPKIVRPVNAVGQQGLMNAPFEGGHAADYLSNGRSVWDALLSTPMLGHSENRPADDRSASIISPKRAPTLKSLPSMTVSREAKQSSSIHARSESGPPAGDHTNEGLFRRVAFAPNDEKWGATWPFGLLKKQVVTDQVNANVHSIVESVVGRAFSESEMKKIKDEIIDNVSFADSAQFKIVKLDKNGRLILTPEQLKVVAKLIRGFPRDKLGERIRGLYGESLRDGKIRTVNPDRK